MTAFLSTNKIISIDLSRTTEKYLRSLFSDQQPAPVVILSDQAIAGKEESELLGKIMKALKLSAEDYAAIDHHRYPDIRYRNLPVKEGRLICFGLSPENVGLQIAAEPYRVIGLGKGRLLFADSLSAIKGEESLKKQLWASLKEMFDL